MKCVRTLRRVLPRRTASLAQGSCCEALSPRTSASYSRNWIQVIVIVQIPFWCTQCETRTGGLSLSRNVLLNGIWYSFPHFSPAYKNCWKQNISCLWRNNITFITKPTSYLFIIFGKSVLWTDSCHAQRWILLDVPKCENKLQQLFTFNANSFHCSTDSSMAADQSNFMLLGEWLQQFL